MNKFTNLFSSINIGGLSSKNRLAIPPMGTNYADYDGNLSEQFNNYYKERIKGGWGLIIVEVTAVDPRGKAIPRQPGLWDDKFIDQFKELTDFAHKHDCKIAVQLHHAGRQTHSETIGGKQPVAPSPIPCPSCQEIPKKLTEKEIYELVNKFGDAALRAKKANFDAVEVHGAHGYLVAQFMSPYSNRRTDKFGGDFDNRMRFPKEIIRNIKRKAGANFPIIFRFSADEKMPGGRTIDESRAVAKTVEKKGVDAVHVSAGVYGSMEYIIPPFDIPKGFNLKNIEEIKSSINLPVIGVGRIHEPELAEAAIADDKADMIAMGRQSLADPHLPNKTAARRVDEIAPCVSCLQQCVGNLFDPDKLEVSCMINPFCGREGEWEISPADNPKEITVVGGGPAGMEAAWLAAACGHEVTLYEKRNNLGGQFWTGALAPAKHEMNKIVNYLETQMNKHGVNIKLNHEVNENTIKENDADCIIVATGGQPHIPDIKGVDNNENIVTAPEVLEGKASTGKSVLVIGGGMTGCETVDYLGELGKNVTLIEMLDKIAYDVEDAVRKFLLERLNDYDVEILTNCEVTEIKDNGIIGKKDNNQIELSDFDTIVLATGVEPVNELGEIQELDKEVHIIGDAKEPGQADKAIHEAAELALKI